MNPTTGALSVGRYSDDCRALGLHYLVPCQALTDHPTWGSMERGSEGGMEGALSGQGCREKRERALVLLVISLSRLVPPSFFSLALSLFLSHPLFSVDDECRKSDI